MPGEKDPTQAISTCPKCDSAVSQDAKSCQNCGCVIVPNQGSPYPRKVPRPGETYKDLIPTPQNVFKGIPVAASKKEARKKKNKDHAEHDKETVKDEYISDEFNMCTDIKRKSRDYVDVRKEEIMRSCTDLAIDG